MCEEIRDITFRDSHAVIPTLFTVILLFLAVTQFFQISSLIMAVYAWGLGKSGQLGNNCLDTCHLPQKIVLANKEIKYISTGGLFSLLLTHDGRVFAFGCGKYGRLGTCNEEDHSSPQLIDSLADTVVEKVWHTLLLVI